MASPTLPSSVADEPDGPHDGAGPGGSRDGESAPEAASAPVTVPLRDTVIGRRWSRRWTALRGVGGLRILAAVAGGYGWYLGTAPRSWWWATVLGFALAGAALHGRRLPVAAGLSMLAGLAYFLPLLTWSNVYVGNVPWLGLSGMEAALVIPSGLLIAAASRRLPAWPLFAAAAWVLGEQLRAVFPFGGFPWGGIAFTQVEGPLLAAAAVVGSAGLAFFTALLGFALTELARRVAAADRSPGRLAVPFAVALAPLMVGFASVGARHDTTTDPDQVIAVIQGNVPRLGLDFNAQRRAVLDNHVARTHELAAAIRAGQSPQPALVIWPENASDIDPYRNADAAAVIQGAADDIGVPILVGAVVGTDDPHRNLNMGIVWYPGSGPGQTYTKRRPVPFGEYMPWRGFFRVFSDKVDLIRNEFIPGDHPGNLTISDVAVGDVICFEIVEDGIVRDVVNGGAQVLVVQTNNATFGLTNETWQQQAMSRVRAVEHGRDVLIAATSGVSAVIRSDGSVESTVGMFTPGYLTPTVGLASAVTWGTRLGGFVGWALTALTPLGLLCAALWRRRARPAPREGQP